MANLRIFATAALAVSMATGTASISFAQSKGNCTCRYAGQNFKTGDIVCIRGKLSRCEFVLNNTSWKTVADSCPQASIPKIQQSPATGRDVSIMARMHSRFAIK